MKVSVNTDKINAVQFRTAKDFEVTLDWFNTWQGNPSGILQVSPSMEKVWDLKTLDGSAVKYSELPQNEEVYATYTTAEEEDVNGTIYPPSTYYFDGQTWIETETEYSLLTYNEMFVAIADAATIDVVAQEENLLYADWALHVPAGAKKYIQGAVGYQIFHIANNGQEENDADFNFEASISVQQGDNTKQLVWEGLHSKVKTQLDLSHIGELDFEFAENGGLHEIIVKGDKGDKGEKGDKGDASTVAGPKGDKGDQGGQGIQGAHGVQGVKGATGDKGDKGDTGTSIVAKSSVPTFADLPNNAQQGDAHVVVDVQQVYVWEQGAWVDFGPAGSTGPKGDKGNKGDQGVDGPKGDQGDQGTIIPQDDIDNWDATYARTKGISYDEPAKETQIAGKLLIEGIAAMTVDTIKYYEGQHIDFIKEHAKFEDLALFDKIVYADGEAKIGGADKTSTKGSIPTITSPYHPIVNLKQSGAGNSGDIDLDMTKTATIDYFDNSGATGANRSTKLTPKGDKQPVTTTGTMTGDTVSAKGIKILKITYIAKKDIKESEMI